MGKEKVLYETKEGCYEIITVKPKDGIAKFGKHGILKFSENKTTSDDTKLGKPIYLKKKGIGSSIFGLLFGIQPYTLFWKGSYKHNVVVPWDEVITGKFDAKIYRKMSEEDSTVELLTTKADTMSQIMMVAMGLIIGVFLGMILVQQGILTI